MDQLVPFGAGHDRPLVGEDGVRCRRSGIPPNRATSGFLPRSRSTLTWKTGPRSRPVSRSWPCTCGPSSSPWTVVLAGQGLEHRGLHDPAQPAQSADVPGEQVVLDEPRYSAP